MPWVVASGCHSISHAWMACPKSWGVRSISETRTSEEETNFPSLTHWRRYVEQVEASIARFREEERALPHAGGGSFHWKLADEDPGLWQHVRKAATQR